MDLSSGDTFRSSVATHLLDNGYAVRTVEALPGHKTSTIMIYAHALNRPVRGIRRPLGNERPQNFPCDS